VEEKRRLAKPTFNDNWVVLVLAQLKNTCRDKKLLVRLQTGEANKVLPAPELPSANLETELHRVNIAPHSQQWPTLHVGCEVQTWRNRSVESD